jgi:hypothetical protein
MARNFAPAEVKRAVDFVSGSEIDLYLDRLPEHVNQFMQHVAITGAAIPGKKGAALTVHFHSKG